MFSTRGFFVTFTLLIVCAGVFALWPQLDLSTAAAFRVGDTFLGRHGPWPAARAFFKVAPFVVLAAFLALYALRRWGVALPYAPSGRALVFLVATMAIGPGLIVNLGLKDHAHRPRPSQTRQFGGPDAFRPWWRFDGACKTNCSFVGGEASEAFWMVAPASLAPPPLRAPALIAAVAFGAGASLTRVAAGGHYLSDVVMAALLTILIVQIARRWLLPGGEDS